MIHHKLNRRAATEVILKIFNCVPQKNYNLREAYRQNEFHDGNGRLTLLSLSATSSGNLSIVYEIKSGDGRRDIYPRYVHQIDSNSVIRRII